MRYSYDVLDHFNASERKTFRGLTTPAKIQKFLDDEIGYNLEPEGDTCYSPRSVPIYAAGACKPPRSS